MMTLYGVMVSDAYKHVYIDSMWIQKESAEMRQAEIRKSMENFGVASNFEVWRGEIALSDGVIDEKKGGE